MDRKLYYGKDADFRREADQVFDEIQSGKVQYYDADDLADISDYFAINNMPEKMKKVVEYGLRLHPDNIDLKIQEVYMHLDSGDLEKAEGCLAKMPVYDTDVKHLEALLAFRKGDVQQAEEILAELVNDSKPEDLYSMVSLMLDLEKPDEALELLTHSDENPDDDFYLDNLASCYRELGMLDQTIEILNRLIDKYPYRPHLWKVLGECYYDLEQYDKSIDACDFALATDEDYYPAMLLKSLSFSQLGNTEKALESIRQAYDLGGIPLAGLSYFEASYYFSIREYKKIIEVYKHLLDEAKKEQTNLNPSYASATATLAAHAYLILEEWDKAYELANQQIALGESNSELYLVVAVVQMKRKNKEKATQAWELFRNCDDVTVNLLIEACNYCSIYDFSHDAYLHLLLAHQLDPENRQVNLMLFVHSVTFCYDDTVEMLMQTVEFNLPIERLQEFKRVIQNPNSTPTEMANATLELMQASYSEMLKKTSFSDEKVAELIGSGDARQIAESAPGCSPDEACTAAHEEKPAEGETEKEQAHSNDDEQEEKN